MVREHCFTGLTSVKTSFVEKARQGGEEIACFESCSRVGEWGAVRDEGVLGVVR